MDYEKNYLPPDIVVLEIKFEKEIATSNPRFYDDLWDDNF